MIMDCVIRYKNMMLIAEIKFEEFILKLVHTDLRSQTTTVPPSNILDPSLNETIYIIKLEDWTTQKETTNETPYIRTQTNELNLNKLINE
jgi:hypothetical protein